jgi:DNA adenine methylase
MCTSASHGVVIERLPYNEFVIRYDRPGTLFYLDPPYWGCEDDYGDGTFDRADFDRLADQLAGIRGAVHPVDQRHARSARGLRPLRARGGRTTYGSATKMPAGAGKRVGELIVRGGGGPVQSIGAIAD